MVGRVFEIRKVAASWRSQLFAQEAKQRRINADVSVANGVVGFHRSSFAGSRLGFARRRFDFQGGHHAGFARNDFAVGVELDVRLDVDEAPVVKAKQIMAVETS